MSPAGRIKHSKKIAMPRNGYIVLAAIFFLAVPFLRAEEAMVIRDGTLMFQMPNESSAVLDILAKGARLNLVEVSGDWCKVSTADPDHAGYIRKLSLRVGPPPSGIETPPQDPGSEAYQYLQQQLDQTESKLRQSARTLDSLEKMLEMLEQPVMPVKGRRKAAMKGVSGMAVPSMSLGSAGFAASLFSGFQYEGKDPTAGLSLVWNPGFSGTLALEAEGGLIFQQGTQDVPYGTLGLLYPLGMYRNCITPYLAAGGGVIVRDKIITGATGNDLNPTANLGLGAMLILRGGLDLRGDLRAVAEFPKSKYKLTGRFYLGLAYCL
ncbi:MAG: hypothetical protein A3F83_05545 [Candidatus Glassbacteria bacterium RIFCSPLOWO2_12_FULL_58_11]|uniref:SH3b domain-containing protein n=1 Tax=Candidatus Glassbacteria bacterium RIFCSPLOWO2_12_FULL_58_11 TaxID=1817867 RepID=A0A1F5YSZ0_9BACT|nr:MAG: hypothetical protein A3F83_05545 [Candidatus Glassbacteria bacterium RIFCSPLOWO2_12_FULL_58_11]